MPRRFVPTSSQWTIYRRMRVRGPSHRRIGPSEHSPNHQIDRRGGSPPTQRELLEHQERRCDDTDPVELLQREREPLLHATPNTGRERILCAELSPASSSSIPDPSTQPAPTTTLWPHASDASPPTPALIRTSLLAPSRSPFSCSPAHRQDAAHPGHRRAGGGHVLHTTAIILASCVSAGDADRFDEPSQAHRSQRSSPRSTRFAATAVVRATHIAPGPKVDAIRKHFSESKEDSTHKLPWSQLDTSLYTKVKTSNDDSDTFRQRFPVASRIPLHRRVSSRQGEPQFVVESKGRVKRPRLSITARTASRSRSLSFNTAPTSASTAVAIIRFEIRAT
ncbi:hypothetical protein C7974DRAFT_448343 [Boeremia exigua]|uniref:uncharacterized protein n=1 Tax=Boeremia exigua TaxID=749465 RepID=UPI001E8DF42B|nr:uncharacterized protein C7974DRAFT_448343 [Boeremia exigua]KAH6643242.1 hypothetical protein C7974DRAFT_448343 [Boeremia exigua]